jgi:ribose transport system substrate-binding protein
LKKTLRISVLCLVVVVLIATFSIVGCKTTAETTSAATTAAAAATTAAAAETTAAAAETTAAKATFKVGLSNGAFTHSWRVQMIEQFQSDCKKLQEEGIVSDYVVQNAGEDVNTQIAQIRNMISSGINLLLVCPNSSTALNPVLEEAQAAGVLVIVYDMNVDNAPSIINIYMDQGLWMPPLVDWLAKQLGEKGKIVYIEGIADQPGNILRNEAAVKALAKYPDIELVAQAPGKWDQAAAQQAMGDLLASVPVIDGVLTQDGMTLGIARAFEAAGKPLPPITGETQIAFIKEWKKMKDASGFQSFGVGNPPTFGVNAALRMGIKILNGEKLADSVFVNDHDIYLAPSLFVDNDSIDAVYEQYKDWADAYYVPGYLSDDDLNAFFAK